MVLRKRKVNKPQHLILREDVGTCLDLLWQNKQAKCVVVELCGNVITEADSLTLFASLAHFSSMTSLRVTNITQNQSLPVKALSAIIQHPGSQLRHLNLERIQLSGKVADYMVLVESFRLCSLQSARLHQCEYKDNNISLDPLVRGLATIPTLEQVSLSNTKLAPEGKIWTCNCIIQLLPQLRSLSLKGMKDLQNDQLWVLLSAMEDRSSALKELKIQGQELTEECLTRIARMLQRTESLQELTLGVQCTDQVVVLARYLARKRSQTLESLSFPGIWGQEEGDSFYSEIRRTLLDMIQENPQLIHLSLGEDDSNLSRETAEYVKMNLSNRESNERAILEIRSSNACTTGIPQRQSAQGVRA